jgi:hypothetical protein
MKPAIADKKNEWHQHKAIIYAKSASYNRKHEEGEADDQKQLAEVDAQFAFDKRPYMVISAHRPAFAF